MRTILRYRHQLRVSVSAPHQIADGRLLPRVDPGFNPRGDHAGRLIIEVLPVQRKTLRGNVAGNQTVESEGRYRPGVSATVRQQSVWWR